MSAINEDTMHSVPCRRAFRAMMWAFLCFLPPLLSVGDGVVLEVLPDALGWLIFLIVLGWIAGLHPVVGRLRLLAVAGLVVCIPRAVWFAPDRPLWSHWYAALYAAALLLAVIFVWKACGLVAALAAQADRPEVRRSALRRRWLYGLSVLLPLYALMAGPNEQPVVADSKLALLRVFAGGLLVMLIPCIIIVLMMGLMATTARMCATEPLDLPVRGGGPETGEPGP